MDPFEYKLITVVGAVVVVVGLIALLMDSLLAGALATGAGASLIVLALIGVWLHEEWE